MRVMRSSSTTTIAMLLLLAILLMLISAPLWAGRAELRLMGEIFLYMALASLWNLLAGYAGLVSVGQQAYVGLGGYLLFGLTLLAGVPILLALPLSVLIGALVAMPVAALIFRLRGAYFAIGTWVIAEVFRLSFAQISALGGGSGASLPASLVRSLAAGREAREALAYWLALGVVTLVIGAAFALLRSRHGLALTALRDNELAARSLGIDIWRTKFVVYVVVAGLTTLVGAMIFLQKLRISPDAAFSTLVFFALRETLSDLGTTYLIALGAVAIIVMLKAPQGLWGLIRKHNGLELFPLSRRVIGLIEKK
jgi:branched-chain amino acid transport system permease protein